MPLLNLSFELPDGEAGETTSANFEPFGLVDGQTLVLEVSGEEETITFNAVDFVDITAATALEVADVITAASGLVVASDSGGAVLLETIEHSAETCLRVTGGSARIALGLDTDEHCGLTFPGTALYWEIAATGTAETIANFDSIFVEAVEDFEEEWLDNEGFIYVLGDVVTGLFNPIVGPTLVESFEYEWGTVIFEVGPALAAAFTDPDTLLQNLSAEGWEFAANTPDYTTGTFDAALESAEDFEEEWLDNEGFIYVLGSVSAASFDNAGDVAEDFEETTDLLAIIEVINAQSGDAYNIIIAGREHPLVSSSSVEATLANEIEAAINGDNACAVTAAAVGTTVELTPKIPGTAIAVKLVAPTATDLALDTLDAATLWLVTDALTE